MWQPTHVQVTVQRAKGLLFKGKNETNDAFVVIALGKEKFQTSIKERAGDPVEWHEECDLEIPTHGNTAAVQLTVYHRNALGMDEFLGQKSLPLAEFDVYERPRTRSYKLQSKPDKSKKKAEKERGELEAKIAFIVKSGDFLDVAKKEKHKSSLTSLRHMGGSLLSLGNKDKHSLKKFTKSVSNRMDKIVPKKKRSNKSDDSLPPQLMTSSQWAGEADPGVISDEDDDDLACTLLVFANLSLAVRVVQFDDVKVSSTVNSSPYSTVSRTSSRHLVRLPDEDSLAGTSYSGVEESPVTRYGATRPPNDDDRIDEPTRSSPATTKQQFGDTELSTSSSSPAPTPPSPFSRSRLPNTALSRSHRRAIAPKLQEDSYEPQVPVEALPKDVVQTENLSVSPPPSPEPPSLSLNFANLTPIELPPPKPKNRKVSAFSENPDETLVATNVSSPQPSGYNPFNDDASKQETEQLPSTTNPFEEVLPSKNVFDEDNATNPFMNARESKNPFEDGVEVASGAQLGTKPTTAASAVSSSSSSTSSKSGYQLDRHVKKSRAPPIPNQEPVKVSSSSSNTHNGEVNHSNIRNAVEEKNIAEAAHRRLSVPTLASARRPEASGGSSSDDVSRSDSGSTQQTEMFPRMSAPQSSKSESRTSLDLHDSPRSVHSETSSRGAASGATASVCSLKEEGVGGGVGDGAIGARSAAMVRGGSVKEKRSSQPLEDEWERKLCGRRSSIVGSLERLSGTGGGGGSSRSSLNNSCASSTHDLHQQYSPAVSDHYTGTGARFPEVKALTLDRSLKLPTFEESPDSSKKHKRKGLKSRLFSKGTSSRVEEEGRVVEGGNDKLPNAPASNPHSRLSQDIHNKFAGKSREDLMEQILTLQSVLERQVRHSRDLEEYIDNLLLRVLDASPHILQAPTTPQPTSSVAHRRPQF
ncbi:Rab-binding domain FIP-RBD [Trinorchestia longiramus]|nr:Rab-binding domain FIP-RBD [Trinorchestia longiramus]